MSFSAKIPVASQQQSRKLNTCSILQIRKTEYIDACTVNQRHRDCKNSADRKKKIIKSTFRFFKAFPLRGRCRGTRRMRCLMSKSLRAFLFLYSFCYEQTCACGVSVYTFGLVYPFCIYFSYPLLVWLFYAN